MKRLISLSLLAAVVASGGAFARQAAPATGPAPSGSPAQGVYTIGEFAVRMAQSLKLAPPEKGVFTPESASWALWRVGVRLDAALEEPLTEDRLVHALRQIGFNLTASDPPRAVSIEKANAILTTFLNEATAERLRQAHGTVVAPGNGGDDFNDGNGKGGKFKRKGPKSPSIPE